MAYANKFYWFKDFMLCILKALTPVTFSKKILRTRKGSDGFSPLFAGGRAFCDFCIFSQNALLSWWPEWYLIKGNNPSGIINCYSLKWNSLSKLSANLVLAWVIKRRWKCKSSWLFFQPQSHLTIIWAIPIHNTTIILLFVFTPSLMKTAVDMVES